MLKRKESMVENVKQIKREQWRLAEESKSLKSENRMLKYRLNEKMGEELELSPDRDEKEGDRERGRGREKGRG